MNIAFQDSTCFQFLPPLINDQQKNNEVTKRNIFINYNHLAAVKICHSTMEHCGPFK